MAAASASELGTPRGGRMGKAAAMLGKHASSAATKMAAMGEGLSASLQRKSGQPRISSVGGSSDTEPHTEPQAERKPSKLSLGVVKAVASLQAAGRNVTKSARARKPSRSASSHSASNEEVAAGGAAGDRDRQSLGGAYSLGIKSIKGIGAAMRNTGSRTPREQHQHQDTPRYGDSESQPPSSGSFVGTPRYLNGVEERESSNFDTLPRHATGRPPPGMPPAAGPASPTSQAATALSDINLIEESTTTVEQPNLASEAAAQALAAGLSIEASLALETAKWRLRSALGGKVGRPDGSLTELLEAVCSMRAAEAGGVSRWPKLMSASEKVAAPAVAKCLEAKGIVIDPNMEQLEAHMRRMREEQISNAVSSLSCSSLRTVTKAKAAAVHKCLMAALDDVEQQFIGGMEQVVKPGLVPPLDKVARELCQAAVHAHRLKMEVDYDLEDIEQVLSERVSQLPDMRALDTSPDGPKMEEAPLAFLTAAVMSNTTLGLPAPLHDWLSVQVGRYLDPFIDGEVEPSNYEFDSEGLFMARLAVAWSDAHVSPQESQMRAAHGSPTSCPVPASVALVAYVRHCITKMNTNLGFSIHIPGMGRQPVPLAEQDKHAKLLGDAVVAAIERNFAPADRKIAGLEITPQLVTELGQMHLRACILYQNELGNALARANVEGEEARRQERLRIWGFAS